MNAIVIRRSPERVLYVTESLSDNNNEIEVCCHRAVRADRFNVRCFSREKSQRTHCRVLRRIAVSAIIFAKIDTVTKLTGRNARIIFPCEFPLASARPDGSTCPAFAYFRTIFSPRYKSIAREREKPLLIHPRPRGRLPQTTGHSRVFPRNGGGKRTGV